MTKPCTPFFLRWFHNDVEPVAEDPEVAEEPRGEPGRYPGDTTFYCKWVAFPGSNHIVRYEVQHREHSRDAWKKYAAYINHPEEKVVWETTPHEELLKFFLSWIRQDALHKKETVEHDARLAEMRALFLAPKEASS